MAARRVDIIPGGKGDLAKVSDFDPVEIRRGIKVEMEHTSSPAIALEIALDHLSEDPHYYRKLAKIHKEDGSEDQLKQMQRAASRQSRVAYKQEMHGRDADSYAKAKGKLYHHDRAAKLHDDVIAHAKKLGLHPGQVVHHEMLRNHHRQIASNVRGERGDWDRRGRSRSQASNESADLDRSLDWLEGLYGYLSESDLERKLGARFGFGLSGLDYAKRKQQVARKRLRRSPASMESKAQPRQSPPPIPADARRKLRPPPIPAAPETNSALRSVNQTIARSGSAQKMSALLHKLRAKAKEKGVALPSSGRPLPGLPPEKHDEALSRLALECRTLVLEAGDPLGHAKRLSAKAHAVGDKLDWDGSPGMDHFAASSHHGAAADAWSKLAKHPDPQTRDMAQKKVDSHGNMEREHRRAAHADQRVPSLGQWKHKIKGLRMGKAG